MATADLPRHSLTFGPSPIHEMPRLARHLGGENAPRIFAKREDVNSGLEIGRAHV